MCNADMATDIVCGVRGDDGNATAWDINISYLQLCEHNSVPELHVFGLCIAS